MLQISQRLSSRETLPLPSWTPLCTGICVCASCDRVGEPGALSIRAAAPPGREAHVEREDPEQRKSQCGDCLGGQEVPRGRGAGRLRSAPAASRAAGAGRPPPPPLALHRGRARARARGSERARECASPRSTPAGAADGGKGGGREPRTVGGGDAVGRGASRAPGSGAAAAAAEAAPPIRLQAGNPPRARRRPPRTLAACQTRRLAPAPRPPSLPRAPPGSRHRRLGVPPSPRPFLCSGSSRATGCRPARAAPRSSLRAAARG